MPRKEPGTFGVFGRKKKYYYRDLFGNRRGPYKTRAAAQRKVKSIFD